MPRAHAERPVLKARRFRKWRHRSKHFRHDDNLDWAEGKPAQRCKPTHLALPVVAGGLTVSQKAANKISASAVDSAQLAVQLSTAQAAISAGNHKL